MIVKKIDPSCTSFLMWPEVGEDTTERTHQRRCMMKKCFLFAVLICGFFISACGSGGGGNSHASPAPTTIVPPLALPGPYTVACSNVAQDVSRVTPGEEVTKYWEGFPSPGGAPRYVTDLLADPVNALSVTLTAPNESNLYGSFA